MGTYRAGIVGCTGIAASAPTPLPPGSPFTSPMPGSHAAAYARIPNVQVVAIRDLVPDLMEKFVTTWSATWSPIATYTDYREMLAREHLDIISVATSDHRHAGIIVDAAEAGVRGVFCEKQIATFLADADRMIDACERRGIPLSIDHTRRWYPNTTTPGILSETGRSVSSVESLPPPVVPGRSLQEWYPPDRHSLFSRRV